MNQFFQIEEEAVKNDEVEATILSALTSALENVKAMRIQEGQELANDLQAQLQKFATIVRK